MDAVYNKYKEIENSYNLEMEILKRFNRWIIYFQDGVNSYEFHESPARRDNGFFKRNSDNELRKITERTFKKNFIENLEWIKKYGM